MTGRSGAHRRRRVCWPVAVSASIAIHAATGGIVAWTAAPRRPSPTEAPLSFEVDLAGAGAAEPASARTAAATAPARRRPRARTPPDGARLPDAPASEEGTPRPPPPAAADVEGGAGITALVRFDRLVDSACTTPMEALLRAWSSDVGALFDALPRAVDAVLIARSGLLASGPTLLAARHHLAAEDLHAVLKRGLPGSGPISQAGPRQLVMATPTGDAGGATRGALADLLPRLDALDSFMAPDAVAMLFWAPPLDAGGARAASPPGAAVAGLPSPRRIVASLAMAPNPTIDVDAAMASEDDALKWQAAGTQALAGVLECAALDADVAARWAARATWQRDADAINVHLDITEDETVELLRVAAAGLSAARAAR